ALIERRIAAVVVEALLGIGRAPASTGPRRLAPLRARPALGISVGEQQSHYCDTEQNKTDPPHGSSPSPSFPAANAKGEAATPPRKSMNSRRWISMTARPKDYAEYSRSKPCIAAKAGPGRIFLRGVRRHFDGLEDRLIVIFGLIDPRRDRPHPHQAGREWTHQVMRVRFLAKPPGIIISRENDRHAVMDIGHQLIGISRNDCKSANQFARNRLFPVLPNPRKSERCAVLHGDRVGLFRPLTLDRLPFEKAIDRHDASASAVRIAEGRQVANGLALGVDWLSAASRVLAPIRDQAPAQRVERYLSGLVIAADDEQFLAGRAIPSRRIVVETTVAYVHAIDDGIAKRRAALDDPPAHSLDIVTGERAC